MWLVYGRAQNLAEFKLHKKRSPRWNLKKQLGIVTLAFGRSMTHVLVNVCLALGRLNLQGELLLIFPV